MRFRSECELNMAEEKSGWSILGNLISIIIVGIFLGWLFAWCFEVLGFYHFKSSWETYLAICILIDLLRGFA